MATRYTVNIDGHKVSAKTLEEALLRAGRYVGQFEHQTGSEAHVIDVRIYLGVSTLSIEAVKS